ncbi:uncharacterized protein LOC116261122 [Nymphaea colorata]|nr:uncharacterized protein LOC116261122 [Nymphaea colorata]
MAAAEARAAWQRTANRCFVQEDAKRAPKLACCQSSSSKLQPDQCQGDAGNGVDQTGGHFVPLNWNPANFSLSPDTKWWLQLQPNFGNQKEIIFEQLKALEAELDSMASGDVKASSVFNEEATFTSKEGRVDSDNIISPDVDMCGRFSTACFKHAPEPRTQELKAANVVQSVKHETFGNDHLKAELAEKMLMDRKQFDQLIMDQAQKGSGDISMPWLNEKAGPWWRITDKDELASLVAQSSSRRIENCDLPRPQNAYSRKNVDTLEGLYDEDLNPPLFGDKLSAALLNPVGYSQPRCSSGKAAMSEQPSSEEETSSHCSQKFFSSSGSNRESCGSRCSYDMDASKVQLLEALCHSQTRAREAENAAQRAHSEKEHIIKLFFKQAAHLFAYKQWFRLLQLENIYLQLKCKDNVVVPWEQLSVLFPWLSALGEQHRGLGNKKRKRESIQKHDFGKFAFAVAVGLSLAGAGLFLGWTLGWLLPTF